MTNCLSPSHNTLLFMAGILKANKLWTPKLQEMYDEALAIEFAQQRGSTLERMSQSPNAFDELARLISEADPFSKTNIMASVEAAKPPLFQSPPEHDPLLQLESDDGDMAKHLDELFRQSITNHYAEKFNAASAYGKMNHQPPGAINGITRDDVKYFDEHCKTYPGNTLDLYQRIATKSAIYPGIGTPLGLIYVALKLNGEAGEFAEHVGKAMRDDGYVQEFTQGSDTQPKGTGPIPAIFLDGQLTSDRRNKIIKELGDNLWYIGAACNELGVKLSSIARTNLEKLCDRTERQTLQGSGDDR